MPRGISKKRHPEAYKPDLVAAKHVARMERAGIKPGVKLGPGMGANTLQETHDELVQQLAVLVGQLVYGHHGPTRMQVMMALTALREALPNVATAAPMGLVRPSLAWVDGCLERVAV